MDSYQIFAIRQDGTREKLEIIQVARAYTGCDFANNCDHMVVNIDVVACKPEGSTHEKAEINRLKDIMRETARELKAASNE